MAITMIVKDKNRWKVRETVTEFLTKQRYSKINFIKVRSSRYVLVNFQPLKEGKK